MYPVETFASYVYISASHQIEMYASLRSIQHAECSFRRHFAETVFANTLLLFFFSDFVGNLAHLIQLLVRYCRYDPVKCLVEH